MQCVPGKIIATNLLSYKYMHDIDTTSEEVGDPFEPLSQDVNSCIHFED